MSPEQAHGKVQEIGPASDVYGLGATLYTILAGKEPFEGSQLDAMLAKVRAGDFVPPRERSPTVPRALDAICVKAMSLSPAARYPSCAALASDVEHWLADEPVTAFQEPMSDRVFRWVRRHRAVAATCGSLLAAAAVGLLAGTAILGKANRDIQKINREIQIADQESRRAAAEARSQRDAATEQRSVAEIEKGRADASAKQAKSEAEHANWLLYSRQIADAQHAWEAGDVTAASRYLDASRKDLRGWEYRYLYSLLNQRRSV